MRGVLIFILAVASASAGTIVPEPRMESNFFCLTIKPQMDMEVTEARLDHGKWISDPPNFAEKGSPLGTKVAANGKLLICFSGREDTHTGTVGGVTLKTSDGTKIKFWWENLWNASLKYGTQLVSTEYSVTPRVIGHQRVEYVIAKK